MNIEFSEEFIRVFQRLKDRGLCQRIMGRIRKLRTNPLVGKPLSGRLAGYRSLRVTPFRIIYRVETERIVINCFAHRKEVYESLD